MLYCNYHLNRNYTVILYVIIQLPQVQWRSQFLAHVERERLLRSEDCNQKTKKRAELEHEADRRRGKNAYTVRVKESGSVH